MDSRAPPDVPSCLGPLARALLLGKTLHGGSTLAESNRGRLAAMLTADVVGFGRLLGGDEVWAGTR